MRGGSSPSARTIGTDMTDLEYRLDQFKREIVRLCNKYGVDIDGCGCCDSPSVIVYQEQRNFKVEHGKPELLKKNNKLAGNLFVGNFRVVEDK